MKDQYINKNKKKNNRNKFFNNWIVHFFEVSLIIFTIIPIIISNGKSHTKQRE